MRVSAFPKGNTQITSLRDLRPEVGFPSIEQDLKSGRHEGVMRIWIWPRRYLGLLHMEVFHQRLDQEYGASIITTTPTVPYSLKHADGSVEEIQNPSQVRQLSFCHSRAMPPPLCLASPCAEPGDACISTPAPDLSL